MKSLINFLKKNPEIIFFLCAFILWTALMCYENSKEGGDFSWHDIKVEANGMIFDLFVFGILVTFYNASRARKEKIERLQEEIDDYRGWDEKEAMYRIVGAIRRLNKYEVSKINLRNCYLEGSDFGFPLVELNEANLSKANLKNANLVLSQIQNAYLEGVNLELANLWGANLKGADMSKANLKEANFEIANLQNSILKLADLQKTILQGARLQGAILQGANLQSANIQLAFLEGATFQDANLESALLEWAIVDKNWFEKLEDWRVIGREKIKKTYHINEKGRLINSQTNALPPND